ncbi:MAG TPA: hypothetical protein VJR89_22400 [Polyangiales bacterium]|nr:hypothetical protein [Polyangiales bacterium]
MKSNAVVLTLFLIVSAVSRGATAQDLEFTLDEVEAPRKPQKGGKAATAPSIDTKAAIEGALGQLRWGMSKSDLLKLLKSQIRAEFDQRIKVERDIMRQDALYQEAQEQYRRATENYVTFDGEKSGWDVSPIGHEFTHNNREAMLVITGKGTRDIYFFIQGKLWKWYREIAPEKLNVADAEEALAALREKFGPGKPQKERRNDGNIAYPGQTWSDGTTRVTAIQRGAEACLIFEDEHTIEQLAVLRHNVQPKSEKAKASAVIDSILLNNNAGGT